MMSRIERNPLRKKHSRFDPSLVPPQEMQWVEFFAGRAACTFEMRRAGYKSCRFDKLYLKDPKKFGRKSNWQDLMTPSGFMLRGCNLIVSTLLLNLCRMPITWWIQQPCN
jgi:hypothetical protein